MPAVDSRREGAELCRAELDRGVLCSRRPAADGVGHRLEREYGDGHQRRLACAPERRCADAVRGAQRRGVRGTAAAELHAGALLELLHGQLPAPPVQPPVRNEAHLHRGQADLYGAFCGAAAHAAQSFCHVFQLKTQVHMILGRVSILCRSELGCGPVLGFERLHAMKKRVWCCSLQACLHQRSGLLELCHKPPLQEHRRALLCI